MQVPSDAAEVVRGPRAVTERLGVILESESPRLWTAARLRAICKEIDELIEMAQGMAEVLVHMGREVQRLETVQMEKMDAESRQTAVILEGQALSMRRKRTLVTGNFITKEKRSLSRARFAKKRGPQLSVPTTELQMG